MYIFIVYLLLAAVLLYELLKQKRYPNLEAVLFFGILVFFACRFNLGRDFVGYFTTHRYFLTHQEEMLQYASTRNPGFFYMMYLFMKITPEYRLFMFFVNVLTLSLCGWTIWKHSNHILFSLLIFIGSGLLEVYYVSGMRQMISMSIFLFAFYTFLSKRKFWWYELFCLLALSFHETAVPTFFVPLLFAVLPRFKKQPIKVSLITAGVSILCSIFVGIGIPRILDLFSFNANYHWQYAMVYSYFQNINPSVLGICMEVLFGAGILLLYQWAEDKNDWTSFQTLVFFASVCLYICFSGFNLMSRVADYMQIIMVILLPELVSQIKVHHKQILAFAGIAILNLFLLFMDMHSNVPAVGIIFNEPYDEFHYPYFTVFEKARIDEMLREDK